MNVQLTVSLSDADVAVYRSLPASDKSSFIMTKLAALYATQLMATLAKGSVIAALQPDDQTALGTLIAAVKEYAA